MNIKTGFLLIKHLGLKWILFRFYYYLILKMSVLEKLSPPQTSWELVDDSPEDEDALSFISSQLSTEVIWQLKKWDELSSKSIINEADGVLKGEFLLFSSHKKQLGFPPNWHQNAMTGEISNRAVHWSKIADFVNGDIKCIWEINRFPWAFSLARAYLRTSDEKYAECFWFLFENWVFENPPNAGVNWKCGQESTFRLIAVAFARKVFTNSIATTESRLKKWRKFVIFTTQRIASNITYALSQNNNHGISECVGLLTGLRIIPQQKKVEKYQKIAIENLKKQVRVLIYEDGSFAQHSTVYHRVVMHDLIWYLMIEKKADKEVVSASKKTLSFMKGITDKQTGNTPLKGCNDGSNILPLTNNNYLDYRPTINLMENALGEATCLKKGSWNEASYLFSLRHNNNIKPHEIESKSFRGGKSGWFMLSNNNSKLFINAPTHFVHRPVQLDLLHVDVWYKGVPIAIDPGTYSYNSTGKFADMFASTCVHNTITVNGIEQMQKISKFLFLPWQTLKIIQNSCEPCCFKAKNSCYKYLGLAHTRAIHALKSGHWEIIDSLDSKHEEFYTIRVQWLFADYPFELDKEKKILSLNTPVGRCLFSWNLSKECHTSVSVVRGDHKTNRGWHSQYYYSVLPAISFVIEVKAKGCFNIQSSFDFKN